MSQIYFITAFSHIYSSASFVKSGSCNDFESDKNNLITRDILKKTVKGTLMQIWKSTNIFVFT